MADTNPRHIGAYQCGSGIYKHRQNSI